MEICGHPKEVWNRSETVWNCRKAAISADPTFVWKFVDVPKRSETGLKQVWNRRKAAISADPTFVWKFVDVPKRSESRKAAISADPTFVWKFLDVPKRSETGLKPSETVGKQLYPLILHCMEICGRPKGVWNRSETVWNCRKAAISADPTFVWKFVDVPKRSETGLKAAISADPTFVWKFVDIPERSETGLKPSETVGKQLYPLILPLYGNLWTSQRGLKQVWNRLKL